MAQPIHPKRNGISLGAALTLTKGPVLVLLEVETADVCVAVLVSVVVNPPRLVAVVLVKVVVEF